MQIMKVGGELVPVLEGQVNIEADLIGGGDASLEDRFLCGQKAGGRDVQSKDRQAEERKVLSAIHRGLENSKRRNSG
jgi:hypothetical protein